MKKLVVGILAHVDAGKTTLSEGLLYLSGKIRKLGRVDNKDSYLDNNELERARGITIFSKQALLEVEDLQISLLDTPGHVDFSSEMERTLYVIDYAILVINGAEGIQGHSKTLWRLLDLYKKPVFIFINKMDQNRKDRDQLISELKNQFSDGCIDFQREKSEYFYEELAMSDDAMMEAFLETGEIEDHQIKMAIRERKIYPVYFGSALKLEGVEEFMHGIVKYAEIPAYPEDFAAKVYKIGRDDQGNRLTYMKITGGKLKVKDNLSNGTWEEKVNQIRIYSGQKFSAINEAEAGTVCAVTGLNQTRPGEGLGLEADSSSPILEPVLSYRILLPEGCDPRVMLPKLKQIEEEDPELNILWDEASKEIHARIMGEVQKEILQSVIKERFGVDVSFDSGKIVYKETITNVVEGVGHFEPLRHYAEVHLLLEPGEKGSGLEFAVDCSDDVLGKNWKNLILSHLKEKVHKGVLTGSEITDMKITLVSGRSHNKHTEGGDFREATYRAVRQGLKEAESILLEPVYEFYLELPEKMVGRAMTDIEQMHGTCHVSHIEGEMAVLTGTAPVVTMKNYQLDVIAYTKGLGRLFCRMKGYEPCHNANEVIEMMGYDSENDVDNPTGSVFCANGAGFLVSWDKVKEYMHVESVLKKRQGGRETAGKNQNTNKTDTWISPEEVDKILNQAHFANKKKKIVWKKNKEASDKYRPAAPARAKPKIVKDKYLLVDGYNIIFAWPELKDLANENMDSARSKLLDQLSKYQILRKCKIIVVFDAYRVERHMEEIIDYGNIHVVYTKEAQTADHFIEKFSRENKEKYNITVATSDFLQQIIIRGAGADVLSARELKLEIEMANEKFIKAYTGEEKPARYTIKDALSGKTGDGSVS